MTKAPALTDDEALWFPVHMSGSGGFSHGPDESGAADVGDGIGLPGRVSGKGPRPPKKPGIKASSWLWLTLWGVAAVGIVTVAARKEIAAAMTENWLQGQGIHAKLKFDQLSLSHLKGHIVIGDAANPEVSVDSFETDYSLNFFGGGQPLARVRTLHLVHPVVTLAFKGGKLNFGSLDKLVQDSLKAPPSDAPPPDSIVVDDAQIRLLSDYGLIKGSGSLSMTKGKLTDLTVKVPVTHLAGAAGEGDVSGGTLTAQAVHSASFGDQLAVQANLSADRWDVRNASPVEDADANADVHLQGVAVSLDTRLPYRNSKAFLDAFSGATQTTLAVKAASVQTGAAKLSNVESNLYLDGQVKLADARDSFEGQARLLSRADALTSGGIATQDVRLSGDGLALKGALSGQGLTFSLSGPVTGDAGLLKQGDLSAAGAHLKLATFAVDSTADGLNATFTGALTTRHLGATDVALDDTTVSLSGLAHSDTASGQWNLMLSTDIASDHGHYAGLNAVAKAQQAAADIFAKRPPVPDAPTYPPPGPDSIVALDRALDRFSLRVSKLDIAANGDDSGSPPRLDIRLKGPASAGFTGGGKAVITPVTGQPLLASGQSGGLGLTLDGPDLPKVALEASSLGMATDGTIAGAYHVKAALNAFPASGVVAEGEGRFAMTPGGRLSATLTGAAPISVQAAEAGDHLENITGTIAQTGDTFLSMDASGWRVAGAFHAIALTAPTEVVTLTSCEGTFEAFSIPGSDATGMKVDLATATAADALPADQTRFNPLVISGALTQDIKAMTGHFVAATPHTLTAGKPTPVVGIDLVSDPVTLIGGLSFHTLDLTFDPHGLQPVYLSPTVAAILSKDVSGKASFDGAFTWSGYASASTGTLKIDGLNFTGAAGVAQGLKGQIVFTSLTPLISQPHQTLTVASLQPGIPLTDLELHFQFLGDHLSVEQAQVLSPGGPVLLQPMTVPFDGKSPISGTMTFDGLDFGKIIAATGLADSMTFEGKLSGKLPFTVAGGHVSFLQGFMASDASGQISIKRQAVTGVQATGSVSSPDTKAAPAQVALEPAFNPFQDLAYQALEYITYDQIDAKINSVPGGKLDVNFHIKGYFDPPKPQKASISLYDYISGKWMQKPIKLPSKTPVELYLDIPVNLDDILNDLTAFNVRTAQK